MQRIELENRVRDAQADVGDTRDYIYRPSLTGLSRYVDCREAAWWCDTRIREQGTEPSCTGHALASIIDHLRTRDRQKNGGTKRRKKKAADHPWASARMLYHIARYHDAWPGEDYRGSSIRGALQGFYYNGVCSIDVENTAREALAREIGISPEQDVWHMNREILDSARSVQLGAYYRVRSRLADVHAALNEAGLVLVSADIHEGWGAAGKTIEFEPTRDGEFGRHAFVVIGYNDRGLIIQNSWGKGWMDGGCALWTYDDWAANIIDQWVLRLAAPLDSGGKSALRPQIAGNRLTSLRRSRFEDTDDEQIPAPSRLDVIGHVVPLARGNLDSHGHYNASAVTLLETAKIVRTSKAKSGKGFRYQHLLLHFMDIQQQERRSVTALRDSIPVFKENGIYPVFVMLENEIGAEVHRMCARIVEEANRLVGYHVSTEKDRLIEGQLSLVAKRMIDMIEESAERTLKVVAAGDDVCEHRPGPGATLLAQIFERQKDRHKDGSLSYHFSAHGFGASLVTAILKAAPYFETKPTISSISLIGPMLRRTDFDMVYAPLLQHPRETPVRRSAARDTVDVEQVNVMTLTEAARRNDPYIVGCGASWPELWSRIEDRTSRITDTAPARSADESGRDGPCFLAIEEHARDLENACASDMNLNVRLVDADDPAIPKPHHMGLDMRLAVLDLLMKSILGKDGNPRFVEYYNKRESFSYIS